MPKIKPVPVHAAARRKGTMFLVFTIAWRSRQDPEQDAARLAANLAA